MRTFLFWALACSITAVSAAELKFYLDGESRKAEGMTYFGGGIRQVPGRFGKGFLIERRTVNFFTPDEVILSDGAKLAGKENRLTLPAGGYAALPLTAIRPKIANTLSFCYSGEGAITVSFGGKNLAAFKAEKTVKKGEVIIIPEEDNGTLRIKAEKAVELTQVMFDKGIGFTNTYHAPGKMRSVDKISLQKELFNGTSGAISCWIKAPWLKKDARHATAIALCDAKAPGSSKCMFYICAWSNGISLILNTPGARKGGSCSLKINELPESSDGWYHFVFNWNYVKDFMELSIIINGSRVFKSRPACGVMPKAATFTVGYVNGAYLNGVLDDFGLFSAPLSQAEAQKIFSAGVPLNGIYKK